MPNSRCAHVALFSVLTLVRPSKAKAQQKAKARKQNKADKRNRCNRCVLLHNNTPTQQRHEFSLSLSRRGVAWEPANSAPTILPVARKLARQAEMAERNESHQRDRKRATTGGCRAKRILRVGFSGALMNSNGYSLDCSFALLALPA